MQRLNDRCDNNGSGDRPVLLSAIRIDGGRDRDCRGVGVSVYLFYIDESGEREYTSSSRYFVLSALGVPVNEWHNINEYGSKLFP